MGMFDYVTYNCVCPVCHNEISEFQTKSENCVLEYLDTSQCDYFYGYCDCGSQLHFSRVEINKFLRKVLSKKSEHMENLDKEIIMENNRIWRK